MWYISILVNSILKNCTISDQAFGIKLVQSSGNTNWDKILKSYMCTSFLKIFME